MTEYKQIWFEFAGKNMSGFGIDITNALILKHGKNFIVRYISDGHDGLEKGVVTIFTITSKSVKQEMFKDWNMEERTFVKVFKGLSLWGYGN